MTNILNGITQSQSDVIRRIIRNTFIIEMGIIKEVLDNNVVTVETCVAKESSNIAVFNCVLVNTASSSLAVDIKPEVDDKVLILFPRSFLPNMFNLAKNEAQVSSIASGYCQYGGVAILINKFQEGYNNSVTVDAGKLDIKLSYDEDQKKNLFTVSTDDKGALNMGATELSIDTGKAKIEIDSSGNVTIDALNGKVSIKNNMASLYDILDGVLQILNTSLATQGSPAAHTVVPQQFAQQSLQLGQLLQ